MVRAGCGRVGSVVYRAGASILAVATSSTNALSMRACAAAISPSEKLYKASFACARAFGSYCARYVAMCGVLMITPRARMAFVVVCVAVCVVGVCIVPAPSRRQARLVRAGAGGGVQASPDLDDPLGGEVVPPVPAREASRSEAVKVEVAGLLDRWVGVHHVGQHQAVAVAQVAASVDRAALGATVDLAVARDRRPEAVAAGGAACSFGSACPFCFVGGGLHRRCLHAPPFITRKAAKSKGISKDR